MDTKQAYEMGHKHGRMLARFGGSILRQVAKYAFVGFIAKIALDAADEMSSK